jgi:micrococcal nuclease
LYTYKAKINRVIDGDTIDLDIDLGFDFWLKNQQVRLNGIDTPETRSTDANEKAFGIFVKTIVSQYCYPGLECCIKTEKDATGKFGRILADIWIDDFHLNKFLVDNHYALYYDGKIKKIL